MKWISVQQQKHKLAKGGGVVRARCECVWVEGEGSRLSLFVHLFFGVVHIIIKDIANQLTLVGEGRGGEVVLSLSAERARTRPCM